MSEKKRIVQTTVFLFIVSIFTSLVSFIKEAIFANYFGVSSSADAYVISIQLPVILFAVVSTAIKTVVVPIYSDTLYSEGKKTADRFYSNLSNLTLVISTIFTLVGIILAEYIIYAFAPGLSLETHDLATTLIRITLPVVVFSSLMDINRGILQVYKSFVLPSIAVNFKSLVYILIIIFFTSHYGIYAATVGVLIGTIVEFLIILLLSKSKVQYNAILNKNDQSLRKAGSMAIPVFIGVGVAEINKVVDKMISSLLKAGSISSLNYASKFSSVFSGILINSISTVMYPLFAEKSAKEDYKSLSNIYVLTISVYVISITPIVIGAVLLREELVTLAFGRGAFDEYAISLTSALFALYIVGLIFSAIRQASTKLFYSLGDSKTPMKNSIFGIVVNIMLNIVLSRIMGAKGLALATTISTGVIALLLFISAHKRLPEVNYISLIPVIFKTGVAALLMVIAVIFIKSHTVSNDLWIILLSTIAGAIIYIGTLFILRAKELLEVVELIKRRK